MPDSHVVSTPPPPALPISQQDLHRGLKDRHVQMIAVGGTIGVGLFLGSATAIQKAGPGLVVSYAIGGLVMFFIMRALGELLMYRPVSGSFATYAEEFVGPRAGFMTGWSYWFMWVAIGMAEITAVGVYFHYWFPGIPQWIPALMTLVFLYASNLITVKLFGEVEFWFSLIKVMTIVAVIIIGLLIIIFKIGGLGKTASFTNLWTHGGFFPFGALGVVLTFQMVMFAYQGLELIGVTAGEAENPEKVLPHAINSVVYRMLGLYTGSLLVIMSLVAWNELAAGTSPFVLVFEKIGIPGGAGIVNFVVITAAASSCNSGIFGTGRMLFSLARIGQAPRAFGKLSSQQVPAAGITASAMLMLIGVGLNYVVPERVFAYVTSISLVGSLWTWALIVVAHLGYRRAVASGAAPRVAFRMPGSPYTNWFVVAFLVMVMLFLSKRCDGRTLSFRLGAQDAPRFPSSDRTKLLASTKAAGPDVADPSDTAGDTPGSDSARRFAPGGLRHVDPEERRLSSGSTRHRCLTGGYAALPVIMTGLHGAQFHGSSVCNSCALVRPETMRSSTSVRYAMGSTPFNFAVWTSVKAIAQWRAPPSLPANNAFFRPSVTGRIARSTVLVSISTRPSSRNTSRPGQCRSA